MPTKQQIFTILAAASAAMSKAQIEEAVGESFRTFQTLFGRWVKDGLIEDTGDQHYALTEKGREVALQITEFQDITGVPEHTEESLATTEYQQFIKLGKITGVIPLALIKQTADHVWAGGDFRDMKWVAQALMEMDIRKDLRMRWLHSWRTKMHQPIPPDLPSEFFPAESKKPEDRKEPASGKRDYVLNEDDSPTYVGEGLGDLDYKDALDLAKIRAARRRAEVSPPGTASPVDDAIKIVNLVKAHEGEKAVGKGYVVKPSADGSFQVEEVEPGKPVVVSPQMPTTKQGSSYYVDSDGKVKEMPPGQPVVIMKEAPRESRPAAQYLIDKSTGEVKEVTSGQPIVIIRESAPVTQFTPIQVRDKDGNPMVLDLATFIKLEEHRDKQRRDEESHQTKMDIAKSFKDMLNKAGAALGHVIEGKEE